MVGISADGEATQQRFADANARDDGRLRFVSDPQGRLADLYGVRIPLLGLARRVSFVIERDGTIREILSGGDAVRAEQALRVADELR